MMDRFAELGGNFLDTADIYAFGNSEKIIGTWLKKLVLFNTESSPNGNLPYGISTGKESD